MEYSKIKTIAAQNKIILKDLAEKIGFSEAGFFQMIRNNSMKVETLEKIASVLQVPVTAFFGETSEPLTELNKLKEENQKLKQENENLNLLVELLKKEKR